MGIKVNPIPWGKYILTKGAFTGMTCDGWGENKEIMECDVMYNSSIVAFFNVHDIRIEGDLKDAVIEGNPGIQSEGGIDFIEGMDLDYKIKIGETEINFIPMNEDKNMMFTIKPDLKKTITCTAHHIEGTKPRWKDTPDERDTQLRCRV